MANTILTPTAVTREILRLAHNKAKFIGSINRQYDDSYAKSGAKIGNDLKIRQPNKYTVTTGATMNVQDTPETSTTLTVSTQKHVGVKFSSAELTMSMQDFSKRILDPAVAVLIANVEADAYSMYKNVYNVIDGDAAALTFYHVADAVRALEDGLAPPDNRNAMLSTVHTAKFLDVTKGLFNNTATLGKQYTSGMIGNAVGLDFYSNPIVAKHQTGTAVATTLYTVNGATQSGATITVQTGTTTFLIGDVVTFAGANAVHPETKADLGYLQKFVITANSGASATSLAISPSLTISGASQNVTGYPTDVGAVVKIGVAAVASATMDTSMVYHQDAFTFATADLVMPQGVDFAAREVLDGISVRVVRQYDINNDQYPCRIDILYGYKALRPEWAVRVHADG